MVFEDRISVYPGRYNITDENGNVSTVILERADEPTVVGTPLNADTFNSMQEETQALDITDKVELEPYTTETGMTLTLGDKRFLYSKQLGVVFFHVTLGFDGTLQSNGIYSLRHKSGYLGKRNNAGNVVKFPIVVDAPEFHECIYAAMYNGETSNYSLIRLMANTAVTTYQSTVSISGWYFCDGE